MLGLAVEEREKRMSEKRNQRQQPPTSRDSHGLVGKNGNIKFFFFRHLRHP